MQPPPLSTAERNAATAAAPDASVAADVAADAASDADVSRQSRSPAAPTLTPPSPLILLAPRPLVPLQPRLQLTPAHLTAAIAVVDSQSSVESSAGAANAKASGRPRRSTRPTLVMPAPASTVGATREPAPSPTLSATSSSAQLSGDTTPRRRSMKKCTISFCESFARSRGLCKAHGGGKRCKRPGCEVSDQGGGFCIRHGGGKRCLVDGCDKSAQSRHYCKAHGGGARCQAVGCVKSSQGGGFCRSHGGGPRRRKAVNNRGERVESPRSTKRTKFRAQVAARVLMGAAQAIEEKEAREEQEKALATREGQRVECEQGATALSFRIRPIEYKAAAAAATKRAAVKRAASEAFNSSDDDDNTTADRREISEEDDDDTQMFIAASLLGMQTASAE